MPPILAHLPVLAPLGVLAILAAGPTSVAAVDGFGEAARAELAPTGTLRVGLVEAPSAGVLFVSRGADGRAAGVTADLAQDLGRAAERPVAVTLYPNTGAATDALRAGTIDLSFMPVDAARRAVLAFGPGYYDLESTYLVVGGTGIADGVDRADLRVVAIAGTTTYRASARTLTRTQPTAVPTVAEAIRRMKAGEADAFALSRDTLQPIAAEVPGSRIVAGSFQRTQIAVALPQGRPAALDAVTRWLDAAKRSGRVRAIFDAHGLAGSAVSAP